MKISFIAGFGPITRDEGARGFWGDALGIPLTEVGPGYWGAHELAGANAFALWPLAHAAQAVFGAEAPNEPTVDLKALHAKIGQLALENDFLEGALTKAGLLSAKR